MNNERKKITGRTAALAVSLVLHALVLIGLVAVPARRPAPEPVVMAVYLAMPAAVPERALVQQVIPVKKSLKAQAQARPEPKPFPKAARVTPQPEARSVIMEEAPTIKTSIEPVAGDGEKAAFEDSKLDLSEVTTKEAPETLESQNREVAVDDTGASTPGPEAMAVDSQLAILNSQSASALLAFAGDPASLGMFVHDVTAPDVEEAVILSLPEPAYPVLSRRRGEEGRVVIEVEISAEGKVLKARVANSSSFSRLDKAALKAIESAAFSPATEYGRPVESVTKVAYRFELEK